MIGPRIGDLTVIEVKEFVRESVAQSIAAVVGDPDQGLRLRDEFAEELQRSPAGVEAGGRTTTPPPHRVCMPTSSE